MSALDVQIGGEHYKNAKIQPIQYIEANGLGFLEGCVVKRVTRHDKPTGKGRQDIEKAIHELQLLLEFRYPEQPVDALSYGTALHQALASRTNPPGEDTYAEFAARMGTVPGREASTKCEECNAVSRGGRTHVATCSQLTAPEEYKAEAQVAFDEAAEISEALARQVSGGTSGYHCGHCGNAGGTPHHTDCWQVRKGKSRFSQETTKVHGVTAEVIAVDECSAYAEPAAAMDDDSPRMQAIGQNGNDGEHYDDPWAGAPEWAKYKAQDGDGRWYWYQTKPIVSSCGLRAWLRDGGEAVLHGSDERNPNWRDTLTTRT